jgi:hypothetical protein
MPTVFASVSVTILLFYLATMGLVYSHHFPVGFHMLWGLFTATLIILLQCLIFGFFIGSGKSIKQKVQEHGLSPEWVQKTKDYKNRSYPALMLAILFSVAAAVLGGGVSVEAVPVWVHHVFIWTALLLNIRSLWISYQVVVDNVNAIHRMNEEIRNRNRERNVTPPPRVIKPEEPAAPKARPNPAANFYFLGFAVWVPYLYVKLSLGSRTFPFWPFMALSGLCLLIGWFKSRKVSAT